MAFTPSLSSVRFKRACVVARHVTSAPNAKRLLRRCGFILDEQKPDFVVTLGGDGTYLHAERQYPGVPKLLSRDSRLCIKCADMPLNESLKRIAQGRFDLLTIPKLQATVTHRAIHRRARRKTSTYWCTNDFVVRNKHPTRALRFSVAYNGTKTGELVGDGVVIATPWGSSAYFYSIARRTFDSGFALAFSNSTKARAPVFLKHHEKIAVKVLRGPGEFACDNDPNVITLTEGDQVTVRQSTRVAQVISVHNGSITLKPGQK